ncbi:MAG: beta-ketoacyl-ACP synthase 3, partial [Phycisphaerales bacterium]|nr:beta-ketoacyl-ACP synthase 3 [Phycisphaerales bacterium]
MFIVSVDGDDGMTVRAGIIGVGSAVPPNVVTNEQLEAAMSLSSGWIARRTGVQERRIVAPGVSSGDLAVEAGRHALHDAELDGCDVDLVLLATSTPDHLLPPTAPRVAHDLGANGAGAIDLAGACAGFVYALSLGAAHVLMRRKPVLVIGANVLSGRVNRDDLATAVIFADGAGAVVLAPADDTDGDRTAGVLSTVLASDGTNIDALLIPAGGSRQPMNAAAVQAGEHLMQLNDGRDVYRRAVRGMTEAGERALRDAACTADDITWWIPHQANQRI